MQPTRGRTHSGTVDRQQLHAAVCTGLLDTLQECSASKGSSGTHTPDRYALSQQVCITILAPAAGLYRLRARSKGTSFACLRLPAPLSLCLHIGRRNGTNFMLQSVFAKMQIAIKWMLQVPLSGEDFEHVACSKRGTPYVHAGQHQQ